MPAYAVEFKSTNGDMKEAKLQCAYDGALMTEGAHAVHTHTKKSDDNFYGRIQALTVAFNGETLNFYAHHAVQVPISSHLATHEASDNGLDKTTGVANETAITVEYHQYLLDCDNPRVSFEAFQNAYRHTRNAQDVAYKLATERKDALWAFAHKSNKKTLSDAPILVQQPSSNILDSISSDLPDTFGDDHDDQVGPTDQLLRESRLTFAEKISTQTITSTDAPTYNPITPPQSSNEVLLLHESKQRPIASVHNHRTRRARTRAAKGPTEVDHIFNARKTRKKNP